MSSKKPTIISTFAGCGGSCLGFHLAGYEELLAVEWDSNAVATFRRNFPDVPVFHGDIAQLTNEECSRLSNIQPGELDIFNGSPPCQGFSTAGKRQLDDPRNNLFRQYVRLLNYLQPKAFVLENVKGMIQGDMKSLYLECTAMLRECGYRVKGQVMNSMYFGVPQRRERVIIIGIRNDLAIEPSHPKPFTSPITAGEAVRDLVVDETERQMLLAAGLKYKNYQLWDTLPPGRGDFACVLSPEKPCFTITKQNGIVGAKGIMHWDERRRPTIAEFKRFSSFPDDFQFEGSYGDAVSRMGNCVPPLLMRAIAIHLKKILNL
jgi:DNA (cytosine-5)-methyltransferase 1